MGCCNNGNVQSGMFMGPYLTQDVDAYAALNPRLKMNSGWSNYKNVKSGNYNRQPCWRCAGFKGFPQAPGVYPLNIVDTPVPLPNRHAMDIADRNYQIYQAARLSNNPGSYCGRHVNYLNNDHAFVYPERYVKGYWPDEQLIYTNTAKGSCHTVKN